MYVHTCVQVTLSHNDNIYPTYINHLGPIIQTNMANIDVSIFPAEVDQACPQNDPHFPYLCKSGWMFVTGTDTWCPVN